MVSYVHLLQAVTPKKYDVRFEFSKLGEDDGFAGYLKADLELAKPSHTVELHAKCIDIQSAFVKLQSGLTIKMTQAVKQDATESVLLTFESVLSGSILLESSFSGSIRGPLNGLYHCDFNGIAGASTHFEPVYARYVFPCIDEPAAKACFKISIVAPSALTVVSNMPQESSRVLSDGVTEHVFAETPRMSSYLLGFAIGDFSVIHEPGNSPIPMALYAPRGKEKMGQFALEIAAYSLAFFEKFFDQKFPLPKLDLVVPPAFPIGGMENWGIITLTDRSLIDETASLQKRQGVASLVAHEVSHMWFGDLVTPAWWDDLWLKEGFASWVNLLPLDAKFPEWRVWDSWILSLLYGGKKSGALEVDQYKATHPIEVAVNHPDEVQEIFDELSYNKGSAVVNMLYHSLGHDTFRKGLSDWLEKCKNGNSTTNELWACLEKASGQPVAEMMSSWTKNCGFPVLEVNLSVCGDIWEVTQRRFSLHDSHHCLHAQDENGKQEKRVKLNPWTVPICIQHDGSQSTERTTFSETRTTIPRKGRWIKVNSGIRTPLRVCYAPELLKVIVKSGSALQPTDRVGLVNDTFAMMRAGMVEPATLLSLCESLLPSEKDPMAWVGHIGILRKALTVFEDSFDKDEAPELPRFLIHLVVPLKDRLGWEEPAQEDAWDSLLRPEVLSLLAACQEPMVCKESIQRAETYLCAQHPAPKKSSINLKAAFESACSICGGLEIPNSAVRGVALKVGLSNKGALWKPMCERLKVVSNTEERDQLLVAMMGHSDRMVLENWVASAIQGQLPSQEWGTMFAGLAGNRHHKRLAWNMLTRHWDAVYKVWGQSQFKMKAIIASAMVKADPDEVELFFDSHPCEMAKRTIQQGLEGLAADAFLSAKAKDLHNYFQSGMAVL